MKALSYTATVASGSSNWKGQAGPEGSQRQGEVAVQWVNRRSCRSRRGRGGRNVAGLQGGRLRTRNGSSRWHKPRAVSCSQGGGGKNMPWEVGSVKARHKRHIFYDRIYRTDPQ